MGQLTISQHWSTGLSSYPITCKCSGAWWWVFVSNCHALLTTHSFQLQLLLTAGYWPTEWQNWEYFPAVTSLHNSSCAGCVCVCYAGWALNAYGTGPCLGLCVLETDGPTPSAGIITKTISHIFFFFLQNSYIYKLDELLGDKFANCISNN